MRMTITDVDHAPGELYAQVPLVVDLLKPMGGAQGVTYWLGRLQRPIRWVFDGGEREVTHLVLQARWVGDRIRSGARPLPVNIIYVTDDTLLGDTELDGAKGRFVAIGTCDITE